MISQLWLRSLEEATMLIKRKVTSKRKDVYTSRADSRENGETKQMHFANKCCGGNPGTCQVEVLGSDETVIDLEFMRPPPFTLDKPPGPILFIPAHLFQ